MGFKELVHFFNVVRLITTKLYYSPTILLMAAGPIVTSSVLCLKFVIYMFSSCIFVSPDKGFIALLKKPAFCFTDFPVLSSCFQLYSFLLLSLILYSSLLLCVYIAFVYLVFFFFVRIRLLIPIIISDVLEAINYPFRMA